MHRPGLSRPAELRWLFLDLNSYFASVEQQRNPALRAKPVAVVPVLAETTCAIAASYEAKAYGIKTGTPVWQMRQLCPHIQIVVARHGPYVAYHHRILAAIDRHIPVESVESIDEVACRLSPSQRTAEAATALARQIKAGIQQEVGDCLRCSIGLAPNQFLAKVATELQKPDGLVILSAESLPGPLLDLSLRDLPGIGPRMEARLHAAGIQTMAALWRTSPETMRRLWGGVVGERFWYALHGYELPASARPSSAGQQKSISHSHVLPPEDRTPQACYVIARDLLLKAASRLRRSGYTASALTLGLRWEWGGHRWVGEQRFAASQDSFTLLAALDALWRQAHQRARIRKVGLVLHGLLDATTRQISLFETVDDTLARRQTLSTLVDTLNTQLGGKIVSIGPPRRVSQEQADLGRKIAFNRIPDTEAFESGEH